jgi:formylglycine-generating enzyme required for sulfatase activity
MKRAAQLFATVLVGVLVGSGAFAVEACGSSDPDVSPGGEGGPGDRDGEGDGGPTEDGRAGDGAPGEDGGGDASTPDAHASCSGVTPTCAGNQDCCAAKAVPGGTFNRSNDGAFPATVSDFALDVYEVTVGRFRAFVNAGKGTQASPPATGAGAHPKIAASGWDPSFNAGLAATTAELRAGLACNPMYPAWTDAPGANEAKPINCVTWFDAFAFCAWDGGRLPTEAEWNYAAAGGSEQREYPSGATMDPTKASYDCTGDGSGAGACTFADLLPVGSRSPQGDGKWGHADLAGNVWEWSLDWYAFPYRLTTCVDCADLQPAPHRAFRGGGLANEALYQRTLIRVDDVPSDRDYDVGFRCAREAAR